MAMQRSAAQQAVIENRGGTLLVSAAAGSGKTSVLVERLLRRIKEEGQRIDQFLIITFTKAAAEELRVRILHTIQEKLLEEPENAHLRQQLVLLYKAQISTIHAFCSNILREWGHTIDLPSDFTLISETEEDILMAETAVKLLESRYEAVSPSFESLLNLLAGGRDDSRLLEILLDVYARLQSHPAPLEWMESQLSQFSLEGVSDIGETPWGRLLLCEVEQVATQWHRTFSRLAALAEEEPEFSYYGENLRGTVSQLENLISAAKEGWDQAVCAAALDFPSLKAIRNCQNPSRKEQIQAIRKKGKTALQRLAARLEGSSRDAMEDMKTLYPAMEGLCRLVCDFSIAYRAEKRKKNFLDFSDLEHETLTLLYDKEGSFTPLADLLSQRFEEIMVDEYQDTNQVQNAIFSALSKREENLFFVGDVKQSIYRFRLADPTIFLGKYRKYLPFTEADAGQPRKILLSQNFRSRPEVLDAVNYLFRNIMSLSLGEMVYTDEEALYPGGTFSPGDCYGVELHFLDTEAAEEEDAQEGTKASKYQREAEFVAERIGSLLAQGFPVSDGQGGTRPLRPEDVAILLRSPNTVRHHYARALRDMGLPFAAEGGGSIFDTIEVAIILSYLQILDNPHQDVPLLSVLHSPLYDFDGNTLAAIRLAAQGDIYTALQAAAREDIPGCAAFLEDLEALRFESRELSCRELIWRLYQKTNALEIFSRLPGGTMREENLLAFCELASRFERKGHRGLFGFLSYLQKMEENGTAPDQEGGSGLSGVRLLSIHKSKGLEYPVVFLSGLSKRFNLEDIKKPVLFHPKLGLGPRGMDMNRRLSFDTLPQRAVALQLKKELLAEEMRLLYVAMTRAKEKLILTYAAARGEALLETLRPQVSLPLDPQVLFDCNTAGDWILLAAMARPEGEVLRPKDGQFEEALEGPFGASWDIRYQKGAWGTAAPKAEEGPLASERAKIPWDAEELWARLTWTYPYAALSAIPAKLTVTQLNQEGAPGTKAVPEGAEEDETNGKVQNAFHRPDFAVEALGLTSAQRGSAIHTVLQNIRLDKVGSFLEIQEEIARLTLGGYLTEQEGKAADPQTLYGFFTSQLGKEMRSQQALHREFPFSILVPAGAYYEGLPEGERILLQGVIDCWYQGEEGITLIDFKTGWASADDVIPKANRYHKQIEAYAFALEEVTGCRVSRKIIWFLTAGLGVLFGQPGEREKILE